MLSVRCPICEAKMEGRSLADLPFFPFCGSRCKTIDLGRWLKGGYAIPGVPTDEADDSLPEGGEPPEKE